jgi:hypothetical protein
MAAGNPDAGTRASDDDRVRVQDMLNDAYADGRLAKSEWEHRAGELSGAATWADLDRLTTDLQPNHPARPVPYAPPQDRTPVPAPPPGWAAPARARTNSLAIGALACGIGQLMAGFPAGIVAIILGRKARRQIQQTGEQGAGMAQAGIILGWAGLGLLGLLLILLALGKITATHHH